MRLTINGVLLDFDDDIEIERQVKLFEEIDATQGDFSYSSTMPNTAHNRKALGFPIADVIEKEIYHIQDVVLSDEDGNELNRGYIRTELIDDYDITFSFFSGNNNWFAELSGKLSDVDFTDLDEDQTVSTITGSKARTSGITWPIIDNGGLITRKYRQMMLEDFVPGIYVHTVFERIFQKHSIKIQGELISDPLYKTMTAHKNVKSKTDIENNTCYVQKSTTTTRVSENVPYKVTFQNDSVYPYYDGSSNSFDLANSRYVAPFKMRIRIEIELRPSVVDSSYNNRIYLYINGVYTFVDIGLTDGGLYNAPTAGDTDPFTLDRTIVLEKGDILEVYSEWQQSGGSTQNDVLSGSIKVTPLYIYHVSSASVIPNWTQQEFVSNILRLFNVVSSYNSVTKTLTLNLFDRIKYKTPIDISEHISSMEVDYSEFISDYGKRNLLGYNEVTFDELRDYNVTQFFKYGQGSIDADNDFLEDSVEIVKSDFSNPIGYINSVFDMSIEKIDVIRLSENNSTTITGVTDSSGLARLAITEDVFLEGDLLRIKEATNPIYNGDWVVQTRGAGFIECFGLNYDTNATGSIIKLLHEYNESDDVYLMVNVPAYNLTNFSGKAQFYFGNDSLSTIDNHSVAFFSLLQMGRQINRDFKQSLSFGEVSNSFFYQKTLIDTYWKAFSRIVNDPVMLNCVCFLPLVVYNQIDFLSPIQVQANETFNVYYANRITGYKGSEKDCLVKLIKLP